MERWGWPMGPAYLMDVVGIDTGVHAAGVMAEGFPDRMQPRLQECYRGDVRELDRYGQKNDKGFYEYVPDKRGKPTKTVNEEVYKHDRCPWSASRTEFEREDMHRPNDAANGHRTRPLPRGRHRGNSAAEADLALVYGVGFPPFRGGIFRWMDTVGLAHYVKDFVGANLPTWARAYELTDRHECQMLANGETYY